MHAFHHGETERAVLMGLTEIFTNAVTLSLPGGALKDGVEHRHHQTSRELYWWPCPVTRRRKKLLFPCAPFALEPWIMVLDFKHQSPAR